jgi:pilus assembly protein CpaC
MQRTVLRKLGVNWNAITAIGQQGGTLGRTGLISAVTNGAITFGGTAASGPTGAFLATAAIDALAQDNLAHILAEPTLTVMSGKPASFQVGGEFPIPIAGQNNTITVTYKNYGVILDFVATVLSDGRINLHVAPEVSEVTTANSITQQTAAGNQTLPALTKRRAETTVELGSGESLMIAGLLHTESGDSSGGLPGLGDTPIIGPLFRSNTLNRIETETVIVVSPVIVRPVRNMAQLQLPTDGYKVPGDVDRLLLLRQMPNKQNQPVQMPGNAGFIVR